ncbi:hypothetical protein JQS43_10015 [Natronosporangium hydrolyticum]|uniref:Secreted protein n=1 Tax=Natronosporangium hydrolyticum TaxID=2811111 RepID=A0A895YFD1_9ACTN|nr:hypothetical protein [Natronosporangium hydrolyticum]QSB16574.1 hypothetical protein JQS43_10015 [Natronosporangium hydrolyticum]
MSTIEIVVVVAVALLIVAALAGGALWWRSRSLRDRFGPEYDRLAAERDSRFAAEKELRERERRHAKLELRELDEPTRQRYATAWREVQAEFVDTPDTAINDAESLVVQLIAEKGYPTDDRTEQLDQVSVDHARTLGYYRDANAIYRKHQQGEANTEDLRQALVHYRVLFEDLLGEAPTQRPTPDHNGQQPDPNNQQTASTSG